jgi:hypothetical protein
MVRRRDAVGHEVGIDLLLAGSDAFKYLADGLAAECARRYEAGAPAGSLDWALAMAEFAGWWCGRLEAEADHLAGFGSQAEVGMSGSGPASADAGCERGSDAPNKVRRRGRRRRG